MTLEEPSPGGAPPAPLRLLWRLLREAVGWGLLLMGGAMLLLPGPGIVGIFVGLVVLSTCYTWAHDLRTSLRGKVDLALRESVASKHRILLSLATISATAALGVLLLLDPPLPSGVSFQVPLLSLQVGPSLPFAGPLVGGPLVASSAVALGLLLYGAHHRRTRPQDPS